MFDDSLRNRVKKLESRLGIGVVADVMQITPPEPWDTQAEPPADATFAELRQWRTADAMDGTIPVA